MRKKKIVPKLLLLIGSSLILVSGIVSLAISIFSGFIYNQVDPFGIFGHVGIVNGLAALTIGGFLVWLSRQKISTSSGSIFTGILSMVLGHIGAIAGALLIGTAGLILCYVAGVWFIVTGIRMR